MEKKDNAKHEKEEAIVTQAALIQDAVKKVVCVCYGHKQSHGLKWLSAQ